MKLLVPAFVSSRRKLIKERQPDPVKTTESQNSDDQNWNATYLRLAADPREQMWCFE